MNEHRVEFCIIGGVAAVLHGSSRLTQDLDIVYERDPKNLQRLANALKDFSLYPRGAPAGLPFEWSVQTLRSGLNFTLQTNLGPIGLFGEVTGGGTYEELRDDMISVSVFGTTCRCLDLEMLIETKRAAGHPRDFEAIAELELIRDRRGC